MPGRFRGGSFVMAALLFVVSCGGGSNNSGGGGGTPPSTPTGLAATAGNAQVALTWTASGGATSYHVKRGTASGSESTVASPTTNSYTDSTVSNGTKYYYVVSAVNSAGESANSSEVSATPVAPPPTPTGLAATAGNAQVALNWTASSGATSYHVKRGTASGSESTIASPTTNSYTDSTVSNGTKYYYVVSAVNSAGESGNSSEVSATPAGSSTTVHVAVDVLANRHSISPFVYGGAFPKDASTISDSGLTVVRWGGNAASTYNWKLGTDNADNDWYFEDFTFGALNNPADSDSIQFVKDVKAAGSNPLMTMVMLPWVAQSPEQSTQQGSPSNNYHWVFSVTKDNVCPSKVDPYNTDAGTNLKSDCATTMVASAAQLNRTYYPLLDGPPQSGDPANSVYRNQWAQALATAFGNTSSCPIPYFPSLTSCHFYDMDNEIDIWGGTHVDVHPNPSGYDELRDVYLTEARNLKGWDPAAVRLGPVSCCWWFYWNGENSSDKGAHAGNDFLPWWLNEVYWRDQIAGTQSLDIFDIHAYPDAPDTSSWTTAQKQALATRIYRDYWDPTYVSESGSINQPWATQIQPNKTIPFRIPRMRAILNATYPGVPLAFTEWSAELGIISGSDFSVALGDADAYGILGRERVSLTTRWVAPDPANPNYQAFKLYTNYDGAHHGFAPISVSDTNDGDPNLFSSFAAVSADGKTMTLMVVSKDPANGAQVSFALNGFTPSTVTTYTLSQSSPNSIVGAGPKAWSSSMTFAPYTATLLVISGTTTNLPSSEWDLNPDTMMVPVSGSVTLQPKITKGTANVTMSAAVFDSYEGASACSGASISLTDPTITSSQPGTITVNAGGPAGFCHFTVTGSDGTATQMQGGWIVVGNPAAMLMNTGDPGGGNAGTTITLNTTLNAGSSGGTNSGASILFSTDAGSLSSGTTSGAKVIVVTDSSGSASVQLTLPGTSGSTVHVTAEGPYGLGHPTTTFTELVH